MNSTEIDFLINATDAKPYYTVSPNPVKKMMTEFIQSYHIFDYYEYINSLSSKLISNKYRSEPIKIFQPRFSNKLILEKVQSFLSLKKGWYFKKGESFKIGTVKKAVNLLENLNFGKIDAFPGKNGQVIISIYLNNNCHSFTFKNDGLIDYFSTSAEKVLVFQSNIKIEDAKSIVEELKWEIILDSSIQSVTVTNSEEAFMKPSSLTTEELQLSHPNVLSTAMSRFAFS